MSPATHVWGPHTIGRSSRLVVEGGYSPDADQLVTGDRPDGVWGWHCTATLAMSFVGAVPDEPDPIPLTARAA